MTYRISEDLIITERVLQRMNPRPSSSTAINRIIKKVDKYSKWKIYSGLQQKYRVAIITERVLKDINAEKIRRKENRKRRKRMKKMEVIEEPMESYKREVRKYDL